MYTAVLSLSTAGRTTAKRRQKKSSATAAPSILPFGLGEYTPAAADATEPDVAMPAESESESDDGHHGHHPEHGDDGVLDLVEKVSDAETEVSVQPGEPQDDQKPPADVPTAIAEPSPAPKPALALAPKRRMVEAGILLVWIQKSEF